MTEEHKLNDVWYFWSIKFGGNYEETRFDTPVDTVEAFWEVFDALPDINQFEGCAIGLFKDPYPPHYDNIPTKEFACTYKDGRNAEFFRKTLCRIVSGETDQKIKELKLRGVYISFTRKDVIKYAIWFDPNPRDSSPEIKQKIIDLFEFTEQVGGSKY